MQGKTYDALVVGTGPGGASVALRLAKAGKKVAILERGSRVTRPGTIIGALAGSDIPSMIPTLTSPSFLRGIALGGTTLLYCGTAASPPKWMKTKFGIDLEGYADETIEELGLKPLPEEKLGLAARRIMNAANDLGYHWEPLRKFIRPKAAKKGFCTGSSCMMGCACGAKWNASEYVDEAVKLGADLYMKARVDRVLIHDDIAVGVVAKTRDGDKDLWGRSVIISAGGVGTPGILLRSGITAAGKKFFTDPVVIVYALSKLGPGSKYDPPMSVGSYEFYEEHIVFANLTDPSIQLPFMMALARPTRFWQAFQTGNALGIMVKIGDEMNGEVLKNERFRKKMGKVEKERLRRGVEISTKILLKAGAEPETISVTPIRLSHPGGTARIGEVVNQNLEAEIKNLFCCDASVIPDTIGLPPVLSIISFGKRLGDYLLQNKRI